MPRPIKFTPDVQKRILDAIRVGATYELAAGYGGIAYETFRAWRESKPAFSAALKEAEGAAAVGWLAKIEKAANDGAWQAAAWKLERRYPESYARQIHEVSGPNGGPIAVSDPERDRRLTALFDLARTRAARRDPSRPDQPLD